MILGKYTRSISQRRNRIRVFSEPKPTPNRKVIVSLDKKVRKVHSTPSSWKIRFKSCRSHLEGNFDEVDVAEPCLLAETSFLFPAKKKKEVTIFLLQNLMGFFYLCYVISFFFYFIPCKFVLKHLFSWRFELILVGEEYSKSWGYGNTAWPHAICCSFDCCWLCFLFLCPFVCLTRLFMPFLLIS